MVMTRWAAVLAVVCFGAGVFAGEVDFDSIVEMKLALPKDTFMRGGTDPVADLTVDITLTNKTPKENLVPEKLTIDEVTAFTSDELANMKKLTPDQQKDLLAKKTEKREIEVRPINKDSLGLPYVEPDIGAADSIEFLIIKLPDEGETVPEGTPPAIIPRDNLSDQATALDAAPTLYLSAGETSPVFKVQVGKYYVIRSPGMYSIRAVMKNIPDKKAPSPFEATKIDRLILKYPGGYLTSNEEKFRVLPFKVVDRKIDDLKSDLESFERGYPDFSYMLYQVKADANFDEIYALQRIVVQGADRWEWTRVCTVKTGTTAQVAQSAPKKVALLGRSGKGDAAVLTSI